MESGTLEKFENVPKFLRRVNGASSIVQWYATKLTLHSVRIKLTCIIVIDTESSHVTQCSSQINFILCFTYMYVRMEAYMFVDELWGDGRRYLILFFHEVIYMLAVCRQ